MDEPDLSPFRRAHIGRALARVYWAFEAEFERRIRPLGFEDYRASDVQVIARLPQGTGARITDLAKRAGVTKQAIGKVVRSLEERGYVERQEDEVDARAQRIVLTRRGFAFLAAARGVIEELEGEWADVLGERGFAQLKRTLRKLGDEVAPPEYL